MTDKDLTDNFTLTDESHPNYHSHKLQQTFESPEFQDEGWRIDMSGYSIFGSDYIHMNVELINPQGEMVTTIDLWSLHDEQRDTEFDTIADLFYDDGDPTLYLNKEVVAPVLDDNKADNTVVTDENEIARGNLITGTGPDVLIPFANMLALAAHTEGLEDQGGKFMYIRSPNPNNANQTNSNGLAIGLVQFAGFDLPPEIKTAIEQYKAPGAADNLVSKVWPDGQDAPFSQYENSPQALLDDPKAMAGLYEQIDALNLKTQQDEIVERNTPAAPTTPTDPLTPSG